MRWAASAILLTLNITSHAADPRIAADAPLHAVRFVDRNEGWAAGSDGVMCHTIDGGASWEMQAVPTKGRLSSLQFLTPYTGFAAGREEAHTGGSLGVLLATRDGGLTWTRLAPGVLPGLQAATFFDDKVGVAVGDGTDRAPSGLYRTGDGGQSWQTIPGPRGASWLAAAGHDPKAIALAGAWGRLGQLRSGEFAPADVDPLGGRNVHAVAIEGARAVAVGQGGLVLLSRDSGGRRYGHADLGLPAEAHAACDFHGVAMFENHIWIVGRPGTIIFHSGDGGQTWETHSTGQNLPLHAVHFLNATHGWAVGELGVILATTDGGKSWTAQRRGGQRAAILCVHANGSSVPLDLAASFGGDAGYLVAANVITGADPASSTPSRSSEYFRLETALRKAGGVGSESFGGFPLPQHLQSADRAALFANWDKLHAGYAQDQLLARLVCALRIWQPEVVITDFAGSSAESLTVETMQIAFARAADPKAFPDQINTFKLVPWQAKKLYTLWDGPGQPHVIAPTTELSKVLRDSPRDYAGRVIGLITDKPLPKSRGLRLLACSLPAGQGQNGVMDGVLLAPGGTARRPMAPQPAEAANAMENAVRELRLLTNLSQSGLPQVGDPGTVLARVGPVLERLPADQAAIAACALADQFAKNGQWVLAREAYGLVVERYPGQAPAVDACRWLVRYHSSSEARHRQGLGQSLTIAQMDFHPSDQVPTKDKPFRPGMGIRPLANATTNENTSAIADPGAARRWYQAAIDLEPKLFAHGSLVANDPAVRFCLNSARRQLGDPNLGKTWIRSFLAEQAGMTGPDPWREAARMELWLTERSGAPPRPVAACRRTNQRPHLDAVMDEPFWGDAIPAMLKTAVGTIGSEYETKVRFANDEEFLYIAVECKHPADRAQPALEKRSRDADLAAFDRVEILLDLDRDYQTCYRLRVDQRGALAEDCWGDSSWNPRWYVAFKSDANGYTAEIAVALADLMSDSPTPGQAWAANVVRVLPGRGVSAWSTPADVTPRPEGCGLLVFTATK